MPSAGISRRLDPGLVVPSWWPQQEAVQISALVVHSSRSLISSAVLCLSALAVAASPRTPSSSVPRADAFCTPFLNCNTKAPEVLRLMHCTDLTTVFWSAGSAYNFRRMSAYVVVPAALTTIASGLRRTLRCRGLEGWW
ncbi:unnamed protein product, partial [Trichogramma brassicae]